MKRFSVALILALLLLGATACRAQTTPLERKPLPKWLHAVSFATGFADLASTAYYKNYYGRYFYEDFPLARPLVHQQTSRYVPLGMGMLVGFNLLADRMNRSPRFRRFARPMLALQSVGSCWGLGYTLSHEKLP